MGPGGVEPQAPKGTQAGVGCGAVQARRALRPEGLPRSWRLTRRSDLTAVTRSGRRRRTPRLDISWRANELGHPRLGVVVPRHGRSVVERNRLRRRLREFARRRLLPRLAPIDLVIRSRQAAYRSDFPELATDLDQWALSLSG